MNYTDVVTCFTFDADSIQAGAERSSRILVLALDQISSQSSSLPNAIWRNLPGNSDSDAGLVSQITCFSLCPYKVA